MDKFGIGAGVMGLVMTYFAAARRTGRTTALVESLKNGDRVVFVDDKQAKHVERMCRELGVKAECVVISPRHPEGVFDRSTPTGRTIFDHVWLEEFYKERIAEAMRSIDYLERESSGFGMTHIETRMRARELSKWSGINQGF